MPLLLMRSALVKQLLRSHARKADVGHFRCRVMQFFPWPVASWIGKPGLEQLQDATCSALRDFAVHSISF